MHNRCLTPGIALLEWLLTSFSQQAISTALVAVVQSPGGQMAEGEGLQETVAVADLVRTYRTGQARAVKAAVSEPPEAEQDYTSQK